MSSIMSAVRPFLSLSALAASISFTALPANAQGAAVHPDCAAQPDVEDACQLAADLFQAMAPQLAGALAGGEALLGNRGTPRVALGLRATALKGFLPDLATREFRQGAAQPELIGTDEQIIPAPALDVAIGLYRGFSLGALSDNSGRVGSLTLLSTVAYLPEVNSGDVDIATPSGQFRVGFGGKVGLLEGARLIPDLAVTVIGRGLPTVDVAGTTDRGDSLLVDGLSMRVTSWRLLASKQLAVLKLSVGGGQDRSRTEATVSALVRGALLQPDLRSDPVRLSQSVTRQNVFASLGLGLGPIAIAAEVGRVSGGTVETFNPFEDERADDARLYASAGLRIGF